MNKKVYLQPAISVNKIRQIPMLCNSIPVDKMNATGLDYNEQLKFQESPNYDVWKDSR